MGGEQLDSVVSGSLIADSLVWGRAYTVRPAQADVADQSLRELERDVGLPVFSLRAFTHEAHLRPGLTPPLIETFQRPPCSGPCIDTAGWHCGLSEADALARNRVRWQRFADHAGGIAPATALNVWTSAIRGRFVDLSCAENLLTDDHLAALRDGSIDGVTYSIQGVAAKFALVLRPHCISNVRLVRRLAAGANRDMDQADAEIFDLFSDDAG